MIAAAIFDVDGLLIDSEPLWRAAELSVFRSLGAPLTEEDCRTTTGLHVHDVVRHWHRRFPWSEPSLEAVGELLARVALDAVRTRGVAKDGAREALAFARAHRARVALATSSSPAHADAVIERLDIGGYIDVAVSSDGVLRAKPHPDAFLEAARRLGVPPMDCLVLEDSAVGLAAARAAGMRCLVVPDEPSCDNSRFRAADAVLRSLRELDDTVWERFGCVLRNEELV